MCDAGEVSANLTRLHTLKAVDALEDGQLLTKELGPSIKQSAADLKQACAKNDWDMNQAEARIQRRLTPAMPLAAEQ